MATYQITLATDFHNVEADTFQYGTQGELQLVKEGEQVATYAPGAWVGIRKVVDA